MLKSKMCSTWLSRASLASGGGCLLFSGATTEFQTPNQPWLLIAYSFPLVREPFKLQFYNYKIQPQHTTHRESLTQGLVLWATLWKSLHEKQLFKLNDTWLNWATVPSEYYLFLDSCHLACLVTDFSISQSPYRYTTHTRNVFSGSMAYKHFNAESK